MPFHKHDLATSGLQEVVLLFPGCVENANREGIEFVPLMTTTKDSGLLQDRDIVQRDFLGRIGINPARPHNSTENEYVLAAAVEGGYKRSPEDETEVRVRAVFVADADLISEEFFHIRRSGDRLLEFDNVTLVLNFIDVLAGDLSFVELRKRRVEHRTLKTVEARASTFEQEKEKEIKAAEKLAEDRLKEAQKRLDDAIKEVQNRKDLDPHGKDLKVKQRREAEQRKFDVAKANIEREKNRAIKLSKGRMTREIRSIHMNIRLFAIFLPIVPPFLLGIIVLILRLHREWSGV
jgi:ABC-2 type transport system permease protein